MSLTQVATIAGRILQFNFQTSEVVDFGSLVFSSDWVGLSLRRILDFGGRVRGVMQIQENAAARRVIAFAWVREIGFRRGRAGVSSVPQIRAGKTALSMVRCLLSTRAGFGCFAGRGVQSTRR